MGKGPKATSFSLWKSKIVCMVPKHCTGTQHPNTQTRHLLNYPCNQRPMAATATSTIPGPPHKPCKTWAPARRRAATQLGRWVHWGHCTALWHLPDCVSAAPSGLRGGNSPHNSAPPPASHPVTKLSWHGEGCQRHLSHRDWIQALMQGVSLEERNPLESQRLCQASAQNRYLRREL